MIAFAATERSEYLEILTKKKVHILVIGGGITGAGILMDAVNRGFEAALIEKNDFASGTSSRSTKLIHGGLRYLKQAQLALVKETGKERKIVYNNARHLVQRNKMLLPFYKGGALGKWTTSIALWLYDHLAKVSKNEHKLMLRRETTRRIEPLLNADGLKGAGMYYEYKVDDTRLTLEIIKKAVENGGTALNYTEAKGYIYEGSRIAGVKVYDVLNRTNYEIQADYVVNASGPWSDEVAMLEHKPESLKRIVLSKGVHIVVPFSRLPIKQSVYFENRSDKRMIFAIPHWDYTYIGTTDTAFSGDMDSPVAHHEEVDYLIKCIGQLFPKAFISENDVKSTWAGIRPLVYEKGKSLSELSRKDEVFKSTSGLISITGGKLTGYRKMAERVIELILSEFKSHEHKTSPVLHEEALTDLSNVSGSEFKSDDDFRKLKTYCISLCHHLQVEEPVMEKIFHRYGTNTEQVIALAETFTGEITDPYLRLELGGLLYGIRQEMACTLSDYLIRRTNQLYFGRDQVNKYLMPILDTLASELQLNTEQKSKNLEEFMKEYEAVMDWKNEKTL